MIDYSRVKFNEAVKAHYGLENLVVAYYQTLKDMVKSIKPDIVAHFDLITCFLEPDRNTPLIRILKSMLLNRH
jgi:histidinol phosphatase-like PHP family hydrolase